MPEPLQRSKRVYLTCKTMNNPGLRGKLATEDYVDFKGGPAPKTIKPNVQMPSHKPNLKTPAQKDGFYEDEGKC